MAEREIVGSLSAARLEAMLALAGRDHAEAAAHLASTGARRAARPASSAPRFAGRRDTARSGDAWTVTTVIDALQEVADLVEATRHGAGQLVTVPNVEASVVQAVLAELALDRGWAIEGPDGIVEWRQFGPNDPGWLMSVLERVKAVFTGRAGRPRFQDIEIDPLPDRCRLAVVGDWATGLYGAPKFTEWVKRDPRFAAVIHLGDVYYAGTKREIRELLAAPWPVPPSRDNPTLSRFLNGNHEMYCGGKPYFEFIRRFRQARPQRSSCFAMQNRHWLVLGLDTAWDGFHIDPGMLDGHLEAGEDRQQVAWIDRLIRECGDRRVILLSHHPPFHFPDLVNSGLTGSLREVFSTGKVRFWYWGHEHLGARFDATQGFRGRCVGHGGVPTVRLEEVRTSPLVKRIPGTPYAWRGLATAVGGDSVRAWVLDGPNPLIGPDEDWGPHGWMEIRLNGAALEERWYIADRDTVAIDVPLPGRLR